MMNVNYSPVDFNPFEDQRQIQKVSYTNESQKEIWLACIIGGETANLAYNESGSVYLKGSLDRNALFQALDQVILRHEALRATVSGDGEHLIIYNQALSAVVYEELDGADEAAKLDTLHVKVTQEIGRPFDLQEGPLIRFLMYKITDDHHCLTIIKHHIIGDGWSTGVILEDLSRIYNALLHGIPSNLPAAPQISEYAEEQQRYQQSADFAKNEQFWLNVYKDKVPLLDLNTDRPRKSPRSYAGNRVDFELEPELIRQLKKEGAKAGCSLVATLLCAFEVLLYFKTRQQDVVVGLPASGQAATGKLGLVGHCVNLLPIKGTVDPLIPFRDFLKIGKETLLDAYDHQQLTFGELIKKLYIPRDTSRVTLVPVIFNIDMGMDQQVAFEGLTHRLVSNKRKYENFEIYLNITGSKEGVVLEWSYNCDLFDQSTIEQIHADYMQILTRFVAHPECRIAELLDTPAFQEPGQHLVSRSANGSLAEMFLKAVQQFGDQTALSFQGSSLSYKEVNNRTNLMAGRLLEHAVKPGDKVAVLLNRSLDMIVAMLAIIKTGAAYVPLEENYPEERKIFILQNTDAKYVIQSHDNKWLDKTTTKGLLLEKLLADEPLSPPADVMVPTGPHNPIYVLHTSGSTGQPKGVCMGQQALVNLLLWQAEHSVAGPLSKTLQFSPLSFDVSFQEIFATLTAGGHLVLITEDDRLDPLRLLDLIHHSKVNRIFMPFVALQALAENAGVSHLYPSLLKEVMTAGEQLKITPQIVNFFSKIPGCVLYNQYGPTECHVVTELKLSGSPHEWPNLPGIGKEIYNTKIYILDEMLNPVREGDTGELCISGLCLAEGYLNLPSLTAEKFCFWDHPVKGRLRIYRTGDVARFQPDGSIEFLGRSDHQVKIRGYRIELGEIEVYLSRQQGVEQAVVNAQDDETTGTKKLIAYVVPEQKQPQANSDVSWQERWETIYDTGLKSAHERTSDATEDTDKLLLISNQIATAADYSEQADEWVRESAKRIRAVGAKRIVEVGCGGGQFIYELADEVEAYVATDYSTAAIQYIREKIATEKDRYKHVKTFVAEASDFSGLKEEQPDLVLINSVIQYFPDLHYLLQVIREAMDTVSTDGCIFIGDVQAKATLAMHHAYEQLSRSADDLALADFKEIIDKRVEIEDELLVDPEFFFFVQKIIPGIAHVEVQLRKGRMLNETTKYHYDVWIYPGSDRPVADPEITVNWSTMGKFTGLEKQLLQSPATTLLVTGIPNVRIWHDFTLSKLLIELPDTTHVAELKQAIGTSAPEVMSCPDDFWAIGEQYGFNAYIRWPDNGADGNFEVVFVPVDKALLGTKRPSGLHVLRERIEDYEQVISILPVTGFSSSIQQWKAALKKSLPEYMIPHEFVMLNKLPLTGSGKVDRNALPRVSKFTQLTADEELVLPRTAAERMLAAIWSSILNMEALSVKSDFFELGGHSLIAVKVMVAIEKETGKRLPLSTFFENPTIEKLARMLTIDEEAITWDSLVPIKASGTKKPVYLIHGGGLNILVFKPLGLYMAPEQPVYGMQALGLSGKTELLYSMEELAERYIAEILENDPDGPYALVGYSFGGKLAYEMTQQLKAMGKQVSFLGIMDTYAAISDQEQSAAKKLRIKIIRQFKKISFFTNKFLENPADMLAYQHTIILRKAKASINGGKKNDYFDEVFIYDEEIYRSYDIAYKNYRMKPLDEKIHLFRTKTRPYFLDDPIYLGWNHYGTMGVEIHEVPGDHKTFLLPPFDRQFAGILQQALDAAGQ